MGYFQAIDFSPKRNCYDEWRPVICIEDGKVVGVYNTYMYIVCSKDTVYYRNRK